MEENINKFKGQDKGPEGHGKALASEDLAQVLDINSLVGKQILGTDAMIIGLVENLYYINELCQGKAILVKTTQGDMLINAQTLEPLKIVNTGDKICRIVGPIILNPSNNLGTMTVIVSNGQEYRINPSTLEII